ncbi:hypothetical protein [Humibacillus xanthopallidus]|uniref:hypothetical protein n=1 Tax=Humibacillus xanthopallidus TaxID=412689 RepID=UPI001153FA20|nr:hypothetical protein [Humibacillus xanthopallidus]
MHGLLDLLGHGVQPRLLPLREVRALELEAGLRRSIEELSQLARTAHHRGDGVVELVGDPCGQGAELGHPLVVVDMRLE